jgi:hypothetical protein
MQSVLEWNLAEQQPSYKHLSTQVVVTFFFSAITKYLSLQQVGCFWL